MAKHLPPSASELHLLDLTGNVGQPLAESRADLRVHSVSESTDWQAAPNAFDAVVALDQPLAPQVLAQALAALRPGGRLILMDSEGDPDETSGRGRILEQAGYTRILVESGIECPLPTGILMRGEKPHVTDDTLARIEQVAQADDNALSLAAYRGKYVHLLVMQTPNKPVWALQPDEPIRWQAVTADGALLAFSSLPKAVSLMQPAVMAGKIKDVNKVAKFSKETAQTWTQPVLLNPTLALLAGKTLTLVEIDPASAEAPDE
jgi:hypothetical protein